MKALSHNQTLKVVSLIEDELEENGEDVSRQVIEDAVEGAMHEIYSSSAD